MSTLAFPFSVAGCGRSAIAVEAEAVHQCLELLLFTSPGERVHRPEFGTALRQLVFSPAGPEVATAIEFQIRAALQRYLGARVRIEGLAVTASEGRLTVELVYTPAFGDSSERVLFEREV